MKNINIIFDGPPSHESGRFVEVEDDNGKSIKVGEWIKRDDGLWALKINLSKPLTTPSNADSKTEDKKTSDIPKFLRKEPPKADSKTDTKDGSFKAIGDLGLHKPEWSKWYDYKGEVDFGVKDGIGIEVYYEFERHRVLNGGLPKDVDKISKYRILLKGIRVIEYDKHNKHYVRLSNKSTITLSETLGHDPHNKIVIVSDK